MRPVALGRGGGTEDPTGTVGNLGGLLGFAALAALHAPPPPRPLLTPFHPSRWRPFPTLSGGQQALATLALAFAMQSAFPSPFCFFDEVMGERGRRTPAAFPPPPPAALGWGPPDMEHCISLVPA